MGVTTIKRGEIYSVTPPENSIGSEQKKTRPAVIVSNDKNNANSNNIEVVYLTTAHKNPLPTHVLIHATGRPSTALCENIHTISVERFGHYIGYCSSFEMRGIDRALRISIGIPEDLRK